MTVRQLSNEVDEIQCKAIIQQYDYEKTIMSSEFVCLNCIQDLMNMKESWTDV